jgi:hypothetical protein
VNAPPCAGLFLETDDRVHTFFKGDGVNYQHLSPATDHKPPQWMAPLVAAVCVVPRLSGGFSFHDSGIPAFHGRLFARIVKPSSAKKQWALAVARQGLAFQKNKSIAGAEPQNAGSAPWKNIGCTFSMRATVSKG